MAKNGASQITGIDLNKDLINFANTNLLKNYPEYSEIVSFKNENITNIQDQFDIIISKATFEHIIHLDQVMYNIRDNLKNKGILVAGIGPLFFSPFGDHRYFKLKLPWLHVILPERYCLNRYNKLFKTNINTIAETGLNGYSLLKYKKCLLHTDGLEPVYYKTNVTSKKSSIILTLLSKIPFLNRFFTFNIYCILKKT